MSVGTDPLPLHPTEVVDLADRFDRVRWTTEAIVEPLSAEDCTVASHPDACPAKWHLAHTTWFIERHLLAERFPRYELFDSRFWKLFESKSRVDRDAHSGNQTKTLTRPSLDEVFDYRSCVDRSLVILLHADRSRELARMIEIAIQHEQRHQERILTDIKHLFATNPLRPAMLEVAEEPATPPVPRASRVAFIGFEPGVRAFGCHGEGFCFDDERPRHRQFVNSFGLADRLVTNGEWREFMAAGGYRRRDHWLEDGWELARGQGWDAPRYWFREAGQWKQYTLAGPQPVNDAEPVCHVSYYEADAFARWAGKRLPTEFEWELAAEHAPVLGNFLETSRLRPAAPLPANGTDHAIESSTIQQLFGDVWEWTSSPYVAYPGYQRQSPRRGSAEGRFGANAIVLRGGSCVTPAGHVRATYRRAIDPAVRCQFSGLRLAEDR